MMAAWIFLILVAVTGAMAHGMAARRNGGDAGPFWASSLSRLSLFVGAPFLLVFCLESLPAIERWLPRSAFGWLTILFLAWLAILLAGLLWTPAAESGRWIAGILQFSRSRLWVLLFTLPFLPALFDLWPAWADTIHAGDWALVCMLFVVLIGIALSRESAEKKMNATDRAETPPAKLPSWPVEMMRRGVRMRPIADWEASSVHELVEGVAIEWQQRLIASGAPAISGVLCQAVSRLMCAGMEPSERASFILGPDHCGQEEALALAVTELAQRFGETTLMITASPDPALTARLRAHLERIGGETPVGLTDLCDSSGAGLNEESSLILTDAETLSDFVLGKLRTQLDGVENRTTQSSALARIGLVVWWNAHEFSGVDASHVWAVSRRLERLLGTRRTPPSRAAVFARLPQEREAAFLGFLEHLVPYEQSEKNLFCIRPDFIRKTHLYLLEDGSQDGLRKAVSASIAIGWKTSAQFSAQRSFSAEGLMPSIPWAEACILGVKPEEVLSIREMVCQGGRAVEGESDFYVAVAPSDNPYAQFLLSRYKDYYQDGASMNLIGAEGHAELVQRHLLLALREVPDTLTGLRSCFQWKDSTLRTALDGLSKENRLMRRQVRFLDGDEQLQRDALYENLNPGPVQVHGFRVIGQSGRHPVELRYNAVRDLLVRQVDPERLALEAYPHRVLESGGDFYRVSGESTPQTSRQAVPARIDCKREEEGVATWPYSTIRVSSIRPVSEKLNYTRLVCYSAKVHYSEDIRRVLERTPHGDFKSAGIPPVRAEFETRALILDFSRPLSDYQLLSAASVLECVLMLYAAVGEETLRVATFQQGQSAGLAIVELFPGGVGILDAMRTNTWLIPMLFDRALAWLSSVNTKEERSAVAQSPLFRTRFFTDIDARSTMEVFA